MLTRVLCVFVSIHLHSCVLAFLYIYTCMRAERGSEGEGAEGGKHNVVTAALRLFSMYACLYTRAHAYSYSHARALCACLRAMARTQQSHAVVLQEPYDEEKTQLMEAADASGKILRFVGIVDVEHQTCEVKLEQFPKTHAFAGTEWADNIVAFHTAVCVYHSVHVSITVFIYLQQCPYCVCNSVHVGR